jgi:hypothetical protein
MAGPWVGGWVLFWTPRRLCHDEVADRPRGANLFDVMNQAVVQPLNGHLRYAAQCEAVHSFVRLDVAEDGFDDLHPMGIGLTSCRGIDDLFHAMGIRCGFAGIDHKEISPRGTRFQTGVDERTSVAVPLSVSVCAPAITTGGSLGVEGEGFAVGTTVLVAQWVVAEVAFTKFAQLYCGLLREARIAAAEVRVWNDGLQFLVLEHEATVGFGEVVGVGQHNGTAEVLLGNARLLGGVQTVQYEGVQFIAFILPSYGVGVDDDLMLGVDKRQGVVALDETAGSLELRAVVVGDVAFDLTARVMLTRSMGFQELLYALLLIGDVLDCFLYAVLIAGLIVERMLTHE